MQRVKRDLGLKIEGTNAYYQTRKECKPYIFDSKYAKGCNRVILVAHEKPNINRGIRSGQEFVSHWKASVVLARDDYSIVLKRKLMEERGIDDKLHLKVVSKFMNSDMYDMRSSNIILAEAVYCYTIQDNRYRFNRNGKGKSMFKDVAIGYFETVYSEVTHPVILVADGTIISKIGC